MSKMSQRLLTHKERAEIIHIKTLPKKSAEREAEFAMLVKEGNYKHNISVLKSGTGILIKEKKDEKKLSTIIIDPNWTEFFR